MSKSHLCVTYLLTCLLSQVHAMEPGSALSKEVPCAVLERFEGEVEILDGTRNQIVNTLRKVSIPCGGWISVRTGWAEIKHRIGHWLRIGPNSFVEVFDHQTSSQASAGDEGSANNREDLLVVYKGKVYIHVEKGTQEFSAITPNARARFDYGSALLTFNSSEEETQLIAFENSASLENRFEPGRAIVVRPGEATSLNFVKLRTVPSTPLAVRVDSLRAQLSDLPLEEKEFRTVLSAAKRRSDRKFPSVLGKGSPSDSLAKRPVESYDRYPASKGDEKGMQEWTRKLVGDRKTGEEILFPENYHGVVQKSRVLIHEPEKNQAFLKAEEEEKKRLIEELTRIKGE